MMKYGKPMLFVVGFVHYNVTYRDPTIPTLPISSQYTPQLKILTRSHKEATDDVSKPCLSPNGQDIPSGK